MLAVVGEVHVTAADLRSFQEHLPPSYRRSKDEKEARGADLQTLIDRQLMEAEAASRGLDGDPQVLEKLREAEDEKLVDLMIDRQIRSRVSVSEEDLAREYEEKGWREQVETLEFFVPTREKADEVVELLNGGADFRDVAGTHSVDRALRVLAAPQSFTYSPSDRPRAVVEAVFALAPGGVTAPVPLMDGFVFAQVTERRQVELDAVRDRVDQEVVLKKKKLLRSVYLIELRKQYSLAFSQEGMDLVMRALREGASLSDVERATEVYTYDGGALTVQQALDAVRRVRREWPQTEERYVTAHLKENALPDRLMALDGRNRGVARETEFQEWRENKKRDLMVASLRSQVLEERLQITREDLEQYHQANRDRYTNPDRARVEDLLVADRAQAQDLKRRIEDGADMTALIQEHSIRNNPRDGKLGVSRPQIPFYGEEWISAVMSAPLNEVQGPVQTRGGHSIFRVYERYPEELFPLQGKVLNLVRRAVTEEREREVFVQYLQELRQRYADRVHVYPERLEQL